MPRRRRIFRHNDELCCARAVCELDKRASCAARFLFIDFRDYIFSLEVL